MGSILGHLWFWGRAGRGGGFNDVCTFSSMKPNQVQREEDSFASFGSYEAV